MRAKEVHKRTAINVAIYCEDTEMEVTDLGLIGSLLPVEQLLDQYANNAEARKELIYNLLTSNPYDLKTDMKPKQSIGNNNKVLNAYLMALGVKYDRNSEDVLRDLLLNLSGTEIDEIIDYLREEENPKKEDVLKFISDLNAKK